MQGFKGENHRRCGVVDGGSGGHLTEPVGPASEP